MSSGDDYVCTLDQASIKKAKEELNENPEDRMAAVQALRDWIEEQPHIICGKLDTATLLMFLRGSKFSQIKAREKFENWLSIKIEHPKWFLDLDAFHPSIKKQIDMGFYLPLPKRTPEGCAVILYRLGLLKDMFGKKQVFDEAIRFAGLYMNTLQKPELSQVHGIVFIVDFSGVTAGLISKMLTSETAKADKAFFKSMVGRFKGFHYYRAGVFFEALMAFYKPFMPKKWIDRIKVHDTMESIYRYVPKDCLPVEYLPDDYTGPNVGTLEEVKKTFEAEILSKEVRDEVLYRTSKAFWIDESKRPAEKITEHFRKLNVD